MEESERRRRAEPHQGSVQRQHQQPGRLRRRRRRFHRRCPGSTLLLLHRGPGEGCPQAVPAGCHARLRLRPGRVLRPGGVPVRLRHRGDLRGDAPAEEGAGPERPVAGGAHIKYCGRGRPVRPAGRLPQRALRAQSVHTAGQLLLHRRGDRTEHRSWQGGPPGGEAHRRSGAW